MLRYHRIMSMPAWLPAASPIISTVSVTLALIAFAYQVWRARFNQSVDLLFKLEADFFGSNAKKIQRAKAAFGLVAGHPIEAEPILDFFETMALLLTRGALDEEMVWHTFFYWIDHYYAALEPYIQSRQKQDPLVWNDLADLVQRVRTFQRQRLGASSLPPLSDEEVARFLAEEQDEATL